MLILIIIAWKVSLRILIKALIWKILLLIICLLKNLFLLLIELLKLWVEKVCLLKVVIDFNSRLLKIIFAWFNDARISLVIIVLIFHLIINYKFILKLCRHFVIMFNNFVYLIEMVDFLGIRIRLESCGSCAIVISFKLSISVFISLCMQTTSCVTVSWIIWFILFNINIWNWLLILRLIVLKWFYLIYLLLNLRVENVLVSRLEILAVETMNLLLLGKIWLICDFLHCQILI